jgi:hypothetical protein
LSECTQESLDQQQEPKSAKEIEVPFLLKASESTTSSNLQKSNKKFEAKREGGMVSFLYSCEKDTTSETFHNNVKFYYTLKTIHHDYKVITKLTTLD